MGELEYSNSPIIFESFYILEREFMQNNIDVVKKL